MTRLLFIDDDPKAEDPLKMVLADSYQVTSAFTGEQGIDIVQDENPDVVLLDINLPDIDGLEVLKRIMAIPAPPAVVILIRNIFLKLFYLNSSSVREKEEIAITLPAFT